MANVPGRLESIFINLKNTTNKGISKNGIYALNLYALMMPIVVTIDDRLPQYEDIETYQERKYANIGEDGSVWAPLLEKAMAYYYGTYEALDRGWHDTALNTLAGSPGRVYWHDDMSRDELWDMLIGLPDNAMIQAGTDACRDDFAGECINLISYTNIYTVTRPFYRDDGLRLLEMRSPWPGGGT